MKLLLISTCQEKLSEREFVHPISKILDSEHQILHYSKCTSDTIQSFPLCFAIKPGPKALVKKCRL